MALTTGMRLGAYEILALVGAGGMGEVYRARDTRLDRTVAIKVLTPSVAADPERRERFEREARAISSLNHPHICALYDVGAVSNPDLPGLGGDMIRFLVLEYLEGQTLAERLTAGSMPPADALRHAIDICDALDKAHHSGIVHRDLKPANVMLTKSGVKLLDFGLAKSIGPAVGVTTMSMLATTPPNLTMQGAILGTLQYMAPEQIEGLEADARTDIFAFGALLFEMLTGRTAFEGNTRARLLGAILKDEPLPVSRVQPLVPAALDRIISTCLAKDPDDRYQSARDLLRELSWVASGSSGGVAAGTVTPLARSSRLAWLIAALSVIAMIATVAIVTRRAREVTSTVGPARFTIVPPENTSFGGPSVGRGTGSATEVAVSPDGRNVVFVAGAQSAYQIWLRPVATLAAKPIAGTEGGTFPFWSPDSRFIGFFAAGKLKKIAIDGGPAITLCDAPGGRGGSWSRDNVIVFAPGLPPGLLRVSSAGGVPTVATTLDPATGEQGHRWPHFLPDGRHFFYTAVTGICCPAATPAVIRIGSLDARGGDITLLQADSSVSYASGHVVFARDGTLMAQPFDLDSRQLKGDAFPLAEHVEAEGSRYVSASVSNNGTLVYAQTEPPAAKQLTWLDREGHRLGTFGDEAPIVSLALSPDERRVAVVLATRSWGDVAIWIIDVARNIRSRLTLDGGVDTSPVWSPDGTHIAFQASRSGKPVSLHQMVLNGTGADESLLDGPGNFTIAPSSWSADGRFILYMTQGSDVWVLPLFGDRKPFPLIQTPFTETSAVFSPDGRWVAYASDEGGEPNVYLRPFPGTGGKLQVSNDGGNYPVWRADGKELFYLQAEGAMMAVPVDATRQFDPGLPRALFTTVGLISDRRTGSRALAGMPYAVTKDGKRFLVATTPQQSAVAPLTVVLNWTSAFHVDR